MQVSGDLSLAETATASGPARARLYGWKRFSWLVHLIAVVSAGVAMFVAIERLDGIPWAIPGALYIAFVLAARSAYRRWMRKVEFETIRSRGYSETTQASFSVTPAGFEVGAEHSRAMVSWSGISEIAPTKTQWLFILVNSAVVIPRRFFADVEAERAFVGAALSHMGEAARARSKAATAFVEAAPSVG